MMRYVIAGALVILVFFMLIPAAKWAARALRDMLQMTEEPDDEPEKLPDDTPRPDPRGSSGWYSENLGPGPYRQREGGDPGGDPEKGETKE